MRVLPSTKPRNTVSVHTGYTVTEAVLAVPEIDVSISGRRLGTRAEDPGMCQSRLAERRNIVDCVNMSC